MSYQRVIPRDFFNESKLLKCMGQLSLKILDNATPDGMKIEIEESGDPFETYLCEDGSLAIINYPVTINDVSVGFKTTYNSKSPFPFFCQIDDCDIEVFDDNGEFTEEFKNIKL